MFLKNGSMNRRLAFLRWLQPGAVRQLHWYYQDAMTPCHHPAALRFLRLAVPRLHSLLSLPGGRVRRQGLELVTRYLQPGIRRGANRVLPSSWGTSVVRLPCSNPTPAGLLVSDHCDTAAWPLVCKKQRLPRKVFRSSIAWLSDWLLTLRRVSYLSTTQNSLPVAGQALPDGISTRKVPLRGFKAAQNISSPFLKLAWHNHIRPCVFGHPSGSVSGRQIGPSFGRLVDIAVPTPCARRTT